MNMEITAKDKKLLVYLLALCIIAGAYFFGARPLLNRQSANQELISSLESELNNLTAIYNNRENYTNRINKEKARIDEAMNRFPGALTQENTIVMIQDIEDNTGAWISRVTFSEEEIISGSEDNSDGFVAEETADSSEGENSVEEVETPSIESIRNVKQDLSLDYYCNYDNFKRFIDYINNYDERLFITNINASYSLDANEVSGSLVLTQYAIYGTGKEVVAPDLSGISTGTDNIFTTITGTTGQSIEMQTVENNDENGDSIEITAEINDSDTESEDRTQRDDQSVEPASQQREQEPSAQQSGPKPAGGII